MSAPPVEDRGMQPLAAALAWVWPGLGHMVLGHRRRGLLIMFGMLFLIVGGLLIGGLDVVDRRRDRLWFLAQALCGPVAFALDAANQAFVPRMPENWDEDDAWREALAAGDPAVQRQLTSQSLGRVNEIGTLYIALAGLMNLVVMLDALHAVPAEALGRRARREAAS